MKTTSKRKRSKTGKLLKDSNKDYPYLSFRPSSQDLLDRITEAAKTSGKGRGAWISEILENYLNRTGG